MRTTTDPRTRVGHPLPAPSPLGEFEIGRWELVARLGRGDWTEVFQAKPVNSPPDRPADYAVKRLAPERANDPIALRLLAREAEVGRDVAHPNLIAVLAAHVDAPPYHLVTPYLPGATLAEALAVRPTPAIPHALWIARQVAQALAALHARGWRHADVKPANILVNRAGHATLLDLGFCRRLEGQECAAGGEVLGTFAYAAPEIFSSALRTDGRSDVYSLGVVLYEMLTGQRPFGAATAAELVAQQLQSPPPDPRRLAPQLAPRVARLLRRMLAKEPLRRPTASDLVSLLTDIEIDAFLERAELEA